jgi:hypothetical protein
MERIRITRSAAAYSQTEISGRVACNIRNLRGLSRLFAAVSKAKANTLETCHSEVGEAT